MSLIFSRFLYIFNTLLIKPLIYKNHYTINNYHPLDDQKLIFEDKDIIQCIINAYRYNNVNFRNKDNNFDSASLFITHSLIEFISSIKLLLKNFVLILFIIKN